MLQLHGDEGPAFCAEVARRTGCKVIKAARVRSGADVQALAPFHTDFHLLDSYVAGLPGGTGETFDWELARERTAAGVPVILSGGLNPDNVAEAIAARARRTRSTSPAASSRPRASRTPTSSRAFAAAVRATVPVAGRHERGRAPLRPLRRASTCPRR